MADGTSMKVVKKPDSTKTTKTVPKISEFEGKAVESISSDDRELIKPMENEADKNGKLKTILVSLVVVLAGVLSGYGLAQLGGSGESSTQSFAEAMEKEAEVGDMFGVEDDVFSDTAEGVVLKGGIDGEGSHRLLRPGGVSQIVYMTSSVLDLDKFENHAVKIWGETFQAQKAGWLMDVGRVEVLELNAEKPFEEE